MYLVLKKDLFKKENIKFKFKKNIIKINYYLNNIITTGLLFNLKDYNIINKNEYFIYIQLLNKDLEFLKEIDDYLESKIRNYKRFIINQVIKIKNNNDNDDNNNDNKNLLVNITSIKEKNNIFITHIYLV
tara:strand:- start:515 stop:904 length:390 start_codon:yes stop_codon:yes gene_type:complete